MKTILTLSKILLILAFSVNAHAEKKEKMQFDNDTTNYLTFRGIVSDSKTSEPLMFATLSVEGANIATVCNSKGEFVIKVPKALSDKNIIISYTGYKHLQKPVNEFSPANNNIRLEMMTVPLDEVLVYPSDPDYIMGEVLKRRGQNYMNTPLKMTTFYRETIKKGWSYISLSEAVVNINKQPYTNLREDQIQLAIGRKSTDYDKLDTLAFKLQGGPFTTVMLDLMKEPYLLFSQENIGNFKFSMNNITMVDNRLIYVLNFVPHERITEPYYYGKLYIDTEKFAVISASFSIDLTNKEEAARMFIRKKPISANAYPTEVSYIVNYREKDGLWYYGYSRAQISFRVSWKKKLFNSNYHVTSEMAVTNWEETEEKGYRTADRLRISVVMEDTVSGFSDNDFWGEYNVIEPEQPIEAVINKIQKKLEKM